MVSEHVDGRNAFGVNYVRCMRVFSNNGPPLNSFQLVLIDRSDDQTLAISTLSSTMTKFCGEWNFWRRRFRGLGGSVSAVGYSNG